MSKKTQTKKLHVYLGADHGGFQLKGLLARFFLDRSVPFTDLGSERFAPADDYPDYAVKVAKSVAKDPDLRIGILCCRSGQGMCVAANKIRGVRAVSAWNARLAAASRRDDHANVLCLAADYLPLHLAAHIAEVFVRTPYSKATRHLRRLRKVAALDRR